MNNIFEELKNKIHRSKADYSLVDDGKGKKTYAIFSEKLKQSLRDVIHSVAEEKGEGWQINYIAGTDFIKYRKEQDNEFGVYRKSLLENSPDEFILLSGNRTSTEKEEFEKLEKDFEESNRAFAEFNEELIHQEEQTKFSFWRDWEKK